MITRPVTNSSAHVSSIHIDSGNLIRPEVRKVVHWLWLIYLAQSGSIARKIVYLEIMSSRGDDENTLVDQKGTIYPPCTKYNLYIRS